MSKFFGWLSKKPRTIGAPMACIFHSEINPEWFTRENLDRIPCCTDCGIQLIPVDFKNVLVSGVFDEGGLSDQGSSLAAACAGTVMLWAYLNNITDSVALEYTPTQDAFGSTEYGHWPNLDQQEFVDNIREGGSLGNSILGDVTGIRPYLALVSNLLNWTVVDTGSDQVIKVWPKPSVTAIHAGNLAAAVRYLEECQKLIPTQQIWVVFRKLLSLINSAQRHSSEEKLFGFRITTESLGHFKLQKIPYFAEDHEYRNTDLLDLENLEPLEAHGVRNPRRVVPRSSRSSGILGAFEPHYKTKVASREIRSQSLEVVHETSVSVLVRALDRDQARRVIRSSFLEVFGFTVMARAGHAWRLDEALGIQWDIYPRSAEPWYQSKIISIESIEPAKWEGTPWQSQCI